MLPHFSHLEEAGTIEEMLIMLDVKVAYLTKLEMLAVS